VALNLHSFYSGLERVFELVATQLDEGRLAGADWHAELLRQMAIDLDEARPVVRQPSLLDATGEPMLYFRCPSPQGVG
jgi:hypothetical protein